MNEDAPLVASIAVSTLDAIGDPCAGLLSSIREHTPEPHEVLICDNGGAPSGYTRPTNQAIRACRAPVVIVINDDCRVLPGWLPPLASAALHSAALAFPREEMGNDWHDGLFNMWCFAISQEMIRTVEWRPGKLFDETYVIHNADTALCDRITRRLQPPVPRVVCDQSRVRHMQGRTVFANPGIREWAARQIEIDTVLKDERYQRNGGVDELPWPRL